jgi:hypothetical protein
LGEPGRDSNYINENLERVNAIIEYLLLKKKKKTLTNVYGGKRLIYGEKVFKPSCTMLVNKK